MQNTELIDLFLKAAPSIVITIALFYVRTMSATMKDLYNSIADLNGKMSTIVERTLWHTKELERLDNRVTQIEINKGDT